jgi:hypothetical protein
VAMLKNPGGGTGGGVGLVDSVDGGGSVPS